MEEKQKSQRKSHNPRNDQVTQQLKKINEIEKSISDMQAHIRFLLKRQSDEEKKIDKVFNYSVKITKSKIQHANQHSQNQQKLKKKIKQIDIKSSQIRQIRQRDISQLKQTRLEVSKMKEAQRTQLRDMSKRNDEKIKKMKEEQKIKNQQKAAALKQNHAQKIQQIKMEKQLAKKQKQEIFLKKSITKINGKSQMEKEIQSLREKQETITARLQQKRLRLEKIKQTARKISFLENSQVLERKNKYHSAIKNSEQNKKNQQTQDLQESLFKTAVSTSYQPLQNQSILLLR